MKSPCQINRRTFLGTSSAGALSLAARFGFALGEKSKPNILLLITDQLNSCALSGVGNPYLQTPALDYFLKQGTSFTYSYCTYPDASLSKSSILTGRIPSKTRINANNQVVTTAVPNIGNWLKDKANYDTFYCGEEPFYGTDTPFSGFAVLTPGSDIPENYGDSWISDTCTGFLLNYKSPGPFLLTASLKGASGINAWLRLNARNQSELRYPEIREQLPPIPDNFQCNTPESNTLKTLRQSGVPSQNQWNAIHWRYYLWSYYRFVEMTDSYIERIIDALEITGLIKNTIVIFTSTHGEGSAHHQMVGHDSLYDDVIKVPLTVSCPEQLQLNAVNYTRLVSSLDVFPTICSLTGIIPPESLEGSSLQPALDNCPDNAPDYIFIEDSQGTGCAVRTHKFKYIAYANDPVEQLYNMDTDPGETKNLINDSSYAPILLDMRNHKEEWNRKQI